MKDNENDKTLDLLDRVVMSLKETLNGNDLTPSHLVILTTTGMELVETIPALTGPQKKELVLQTLGKIINEAILSDDFRDQLEGIHQTILGPMIDSFISAANGQYQFKHKPRGKIKKAIHKIFKKND